MFSTGFSSGAREGRKIGVIFSGTTSLPVVCHPAAGRRVRPQRHCVRSRRGEAASCRCLHRATPEPLRHREQDRSRRTDRRCRSVGRRAVWAAFHAGPIGGRCHSSGRSEPRPYMRLLLSRHDRALPTMVAQRISRRMLWIGDRRIRSERCITLHTVRSLGVEPLIATTMPHARGFDPG